MRRGLLLGEGITDGRNFMRWAVESYDKGMQDGNPWTVLNAHRVVIWLLFVKYKVLEFMQ